MVRALLEGRKTQTRRMLKPQTEFGVEPCMYTPSGWAVRKNLAGACFCVNVSCPYGAPGDRLWVKESIRLDRTEPERDWNGERAWASYVADGAPTKLDSWGWKLGTLPSIFLPRGLSRITLTVASVRVERLQDITEEDAKAEGVEPTNGHPERGAFFGAGPSHREGFAQIWADINGSGHHDAFRANPWVWVIDFGKAEVR